MNTLYIEETACGVNRRKRTLWKKGGSMPAFACAGNRHDAPADSQCTGSSQLQVALPGSVKGDRRRGQFKIQIHESKGFWRLFGIRP